MDYVDGLLADGEQIVVRERQHWLAVVLHSRWAIVLVLVALVIFVFVRPGGSIQSVLDDGGFGLVVAGALWILWGYLKWTNESYLVTNRRVVKVEGLLNKHTADSSLEKINDAELDQNVLGRMLDFGDLDILTAAETEVDRFRMLRHPVHFKTEMLNQKHELEFEAMRPPVSPPLRASAPMAAYAASSGPAMDAAPVPMAPAAPPPAPVAPAAPPKREMSPTEVTQTLAGLADLRDRGAISAEEYEAKKADLLSRL